MSKLVILASAAAVVMLSVACSETGGLSSSSTSVLTGPSGLVVSSDDGTIASTQAKGSGGGRKPGGGGSTGSGSGTISLVMVNDVGTTGTSRGDKVTFNVSTTATVYPWVTVRCLKNSTLVYKQSNGIFPTSLGQNFTLGPTTLWQSGGADCIATLENWDGYSKNGAITVIQSMSFQAVE